MKQTETRVHVIVIFEYENSVSRVRASYKLQHENDLHRKLFV